ncbi:hypothetical protein Q7W32_07300 [Streptococcus suis]|nr:hypothetical protein [Streptococcus suis]
MIRDQELLINSVYDRQIRSYFKEALDCYNTNSYKACVILSVIAGIDDLFKKIDALITEFNSSQRDKFDRIKQLRSSFKPFERELINFCREEDLGIFTKYEIKELEYCFDLRNSFAHPSDEVCTAEKARYVFSVMIDIVSSKKMLGGYVYINGLIDKIGGQFYYPSADISSIISVTSDALKFVDSRKYVKLLEKLLNVVQENNLVNYKYFMATLIYNIDDIEELNRIISPMLSEGKIDYVTFEIIHSLHPDIFKRFDRYNVEKILKSLVQQNVTESLLSSIFQEMLESHNDLSEQIVKEVVEGLSKSKKQYSSSKTVYKIKEEVVQTLLAIRKFYSEELFITIVDNYIEKHKQIETYDVFGINFIISMLLRLDAAKIKEKLLLAFNEHMTSQTYAYSNRAISDFKNLSLEDFGYMTDQEVFNLFFSILESAWRGTFDAQEFTEKFPSFEFSKVVEDRVSCLVDNDFYKVYDKGKFVEDGWKKIADQFIESGIKQAFDQYLARKEELKNMCGE